MAAGLTQCYVKQDNCAGVGPVSGWSSIVYANDAWKPGLTGTGLATKSATSAIKVEYGSSTTTFSTIASTPLQIIATPTQVVGAQTRAARTAPGARVAQR